VPERLFRLYQRKRIVNVNFNVVAAGLLALALTLIPVSLTRQFTDNRAYIVGVTGVADIIFDVLLYYALHWVANHWRPLKPKSIKDKLHHDKKPPPFFLDATLIQVERALLSPVYYIVSLGILWVLLGMGVHREWGAVIGFCCGLLITRVLHTAYALITGKWTWRTRVPEDGAETPKSGRAA
jgi:hypothetical protein